MEYPEYRIKKIIQNQIIQELEKFTKLDILSIKQGNKIIKDYYNFINSDNSINIIDKIFIFLNKEQAFSLENILYKKINLKLNDFNLLISIIVLKSFTSNSSILNEYHNNFINSDYLINYCSFMINNYLLFDNINNINNYLSFDNMIDKNHIRKYFFVLFAKLAMANIIQESNFKSENNFKLTKMYKIEINLEELPINSFFKFSYVPYDCFKNNNNDYYLSNLHFSSISEVCRKNFNSGKKFQVKDKDYLEKILKTALYPDIDNINDIKKIIITKDLTILKNDLKNIKEDINNIYKLNKKIISLQQPLKEIQQKYSEIINEIIAYDFLSTEWKENDVIYFPVYFDFRGRKYYDSIVGPTNLKITRFMFNYGYYNKNEFINEVKIKKIWNMTEEIKNMCIKLDFVYKDCFYESYYWLLIGIGKHLIKNRIKIHKNEFIKKSIDFLLEINSNKVENLINMIIKHNFKIIDKIEIINYINIMKSFGKERISKRAILKDGTSSVTQISMMVLGPKSQDSLNAANLGNSEYWTDTYLFAREKFKEYVYKSKKAIVTMDDYDRILSREVAKNTGMIIPYSAGLKKCYENFINISKKNDISVSMESKKIYIEYYNFIKKKIDNDFFYLNKMDDLKKIAISNLEKTREHIEETETGAANFEYNKLKTITFDINISNIEKETPFKKRITKIMKIPSKALDYKQTKTAFNANKIHFYDSDKLRIIENKFNRSYITIHDAYLIDFNNCSNLIIYLNESYNKKIKTNYIIDSIFPVI